MIFDRYLKGKNAKDILCIVRHRYQSSMCHYYTVKINLYIYKNHKIDLNFIGFY